MISEKYLVKLSALSVELEASENPYDRMAAAILYTIKGANDEQALPSLYEAAVAFALGAVERIEKEGGAG